MTIIYVADRLIDLGQDDLGGGGYVPAITQAIAVESMTLEPMGVIGDLPTDPNIIIVAIIADISAVEQHPDYGPGAILYDDPNPYPANGKPDANEYGKRRSYCAKLGIGQAQFVALFGSNANPKTRKAGADNLIAWQRTLPRRTP
jgi:hypothetical protein